MGAEALEFKYPNRLNIKASKRGDVGGHVCPGFSHLVLKMILDLQKSIESLDKSSQSSISS